MNCLVCLSQDVSSFETSNDSKKHWSCNHCEAKFLDPIHYLSSNSEQERYREHNNVIHDEGYRKFLSKVADPLEKHLNKNPGGWGGSDTKLEIYPTGAFEPTDEWTNLDSHDRTWS